MTPNRVVATLTPLVFAPLAGAISAVIAREFPGVEVPASALEEIFIAGALIALAPAAQWLRGYQLYEAREAVREDRVAALDAREAAIAAREQELAHVDTYVDDDELFPPDPELDADFAVVADEPDRVDPER